MWRRSAILLAGLILAVAVVPVMAQAEDCAALVQQILDNLTQSCSGTAGNSACFGSSANATLTGDPTANPFAAAGDQISLDGVESVNTLPLNIDASEWGTALLNVHANVPLALSEQGLRYFLFGDVAVENAVPVESAFTPVEPVTVTPLVGANLRSSPSTDGRVVGSAAVGVELAADGTSADGAWLRVLNTDSTAWISLQVVAATSGEISSLPVVSSATMTLMQAFILTTGTELPGCPEVPPSMLVVQAPAGMSATINVNGADIRTSGTTALVILPDGALHLFVLSGGVNAGGVSVPTGFTMHIPLSADGRELAGAWTGLRAISEGERNLFMPLQSVSGDLLYTAIQVPTQEQISATLAQLNTSTAGQTIAGPASGKADCSRFRPTSPLGGMPFGAVNFYWDAAPGADAYRVNIYDGNGARITSFEVNALSTTVGADSGSFGGTSNYNWDVEALAGGQTACTTGRVTVVRGAGSQTVETTTNTGPVDVAPPPVTCTWGC